MPAAIAIPLALAGGSAVANIIGSKINSNASDKAGQRTADATAQATKLAQDQETERRREYDQQVAEQRRQWDVGEANKAPYRQVSQDALLRVRDLLGLPQGAPAAGVASAAPTASPAASQSGSAADLKSLIDSGLDPQQAAQMFNQKYGRTTGNEAKYYAPSDQTSGKAVIGLPDAYLSQEPNGWNVTVRGGSAPRPQTAMAAAMPPSLAAAAQSATSPAYQPIIPFRQLMGGVR